MNYLITMIILASSMTPPVIYDFNKNSNVEDWVIVDDVVMGGMSSGNIQLNTEGHGVFTGAVSLENNGGFSSVRHAFDKTLVKEFTKIVLHVKGDGKNYQFRIKSNARDYYSYITTFSTTNKWQEVEINLEDMYPSFRGRKLDQPNFSKDHIEEIAFLISNKRQENFKLLIDRIELK